MPDDATTTSAGFPRATSHDVGPRAIPEDQRERPDDHRLASARFTAEDVEAWAELEDLVLDENDVVDREGVEHRRRVRCSILNFAPSSSAISPNVCGEGSM